MNAILSWREMTRKNFWTARSFLNFWRECRENSENCIFRKRVFLAKRIPKREDFILRKSSLIMSTNDRVVGITFSRQGLTETERERERESARINRQRSSEEDRERERVRARERGGNCTEQCREAQRGTARKSRRNKSEERHEVYLSLPGIENGGKILARNNAKQTEQELGNGEKI